jgi:hypothetical protein
VTDSSTQELDIGVRDAWASDTAWAAKLAHDRETAAANQTPAQRAVTATILRRGVDLSAEAIALTGSTARDRRTEISDLDYHVVGPRPRVDDLPGEVDVYAGDAEHFWRKLRSGDDFVQWTLRFGCILLDRGVLREGLREIAINRLWPDPRVQISRLPEQIELAGRLIRMGDRDGAQDEVRAALSAAARALLLDARVFPLARSELPDQLRALGLERLADALRTSILLTPSLSELEHSLVVVREARRDAADLASAPR